MVKGNVPDSNTVHHIHPLTFTFTCTLVLSLGLHTQHVGTKYVHRFHMTRHDTPATALHALIAWLSFSCCISRSLAFDKPIPVSISPLFSHNFHFQTPHPVAVAAVAVAVKNCQTKKDGIHQPFCPSFFFPFSAPDFHLRPVILPGGPTSSHAPKVPP